MDGTLFIYSLKSVEMHHRVQQLISMSMATYDTSQPHTQTNPCIVAIRWKLGHTFTCATSALGADPAVLMMEAIYTQRKPISQSVKP